MWSIFWPDITIKTRAKLEENVFKPNSYAIHHWYSSNHRNSHSFPLLFHWCSFISYSNFAIFSHKLLLNITMFHFYYGSCNFGIFFVFLQFHFQAYPSRKCTINIYRDDKSIGTVRCVQSYVTQYKRNRSALWSLLWTLCPRRTTITRELIHIALYEPHSADEFIVIINVHRTFTAGFFTMIHK